VGTYADLLNQVGTKFQKKNKLKAITVKGASISDDDDFKQIKEDEELVLDFSNDSNGIKLNRDEIQKLMQGAGIKSEKAMQYTSTIINKNLPLTTIEDFVNVSDADIDVSLEIKDLIDVFRFRNLRECAENWKLSKIAAIVLKRTDTYEPIQFNEVLDSNGKLKSPIL